MTTQKADQESLVLPRATGCGANDDQPETHADRSERHPVICDGAGDEAGSDLSDDNDLWTDRRCESFSFIHETGLVLPRKGAAKRWIRRLMMSPAGKTADIARSPDRVLLRQAVLPEVAVRGGNVLLVGTQAYTIEYPSILESNGGTCWTMDCDPAVASFGAPRRHIVGSILDLEGHAPGIRLKTILLTGVFGYGVNRASEQVAALGACFEALEPNGFLVLSWNDRRVPSGVLEEAASRWFDYRTFGSLPSRLWVKGCDTNFAFFRRSADRASAWRRGPRDC